MNIVEHVSLLHGGETSGYMPRSGIAGSSGSEVPSFRRNRQTDIQSGCTNLQPHQQWCFAYYVMGEFLLWSNLFGVL